MSFTKNPNTFYNITTPHQLNPPRPHQHSSEAPPPARFVSYAIDDLYISVRLVSFGYRNRRFGAVASRVF